MTKCHSKGPGKEHKAAAYGAQKRGGILRIKKAIW